MNRTYFTGNLVRNVQDSLEIKFFLEKSIDYRFLNKPNYQELVEEYATNLIVGNFLPTIDSRFNDYEAKSARLHSIPFYIVKDSKIITKEEFFSPDNLDTPAIKIIPTS